jgi:Fe-S cluster assembly ATPase SufC
MAMLEPKLAILDETDSGLDIDALRIVANGVNKLKVIKMRSHYALPAFTRLYRS